MLRIAIVGCGKIADEHAHQILRIPDCELVGFCDSEPLMAKQMHDRFHGVPCFDDISELFRHAAPNVVHITTPPQSHFPLAHRCLEAGCHVYVEKPFTVDATQAAELLRTAARRRLKITVGHNYMFTDPAVRMRRLIEQGFLGGSPVHLESYYCYDLGDRAYAKAFLADKHHWLRTLPGNLLQNIISHGISRIAEHLQSDSPAVIARAFTSPFLRSLGETEIQDELRVMIQDDVTTAYFTFSTQMRPQLSQLRVYGTRNALVLDDMNHTLIKLTGSKYKSYLEHFIPPIALGTQYLTHAASNVRDFLAGQLNMSAGMKTLIEGFYQSITHDRPVPIPNRAILATATIMDAIFSQINQAVAAPPAKLCRIG